MPIAELQFSLLLHPLRGQVESCTIGHSEQHLANCLISSVSVMGVDFLSTTLLDSILLYSFRFVSLQFDPILSDPIELIQAKLVGSLCRLTVLLARVLRVCWA